MHGSIFSIEMKEIQLTLKLLTLNSKKFDLTIFIIKIKVSTFFKTI